MVGLILTAFFGISLVVVIIRLTRALLSGDVSQVFRLGSYRSRSMFDPLALKNHGLSPGDVGYDENPANQ